MQKHVLNTCFNQYLTEMFDSECVFPPGKKKKEEMKIKIKANTTEKA